MPSYKVKSSISYGEEKDGKSTTKNYGPGDSIELSPEQAYEIRHALVNPPHLASITKMTAAEKAAYDSAVNAPDHKDSGVQANWKLDQFARDNAPKVKPTAEVKPAAAAKPPAPPVPPAK